jgi:uncharacterized protein YaaQ
MKLVFSIVHDEDALGLVDALNAEGFSVTKLCSTGGFLRAGNTTLLIGVKDEEVDPILGIIEKNSRKRVKSVKYPIPAGGFYIPSSKEIEVGGATVFILNVDRFEKV